MTFSLTPGKLGFKIGDVLVGLVRRTGKWRATLQSKHLGCFGTPEEAFEAYKAAAIAKFGDFALNE